jgi:hypothetical protein
MERLAHYFTAFQAFVMREAENEHGRFDMRIALELLRREAEYRAEGASTQGIFLYQFESLCRNRLGYDRGLMAVAADPIYDEAWRGWLNKLRRQVGNIEVSDLIYVRSEYYNVVQQRRGRPGLPAGETPLFGEREGRIALANRRKDPLLLFSALHRQLGYPAVPRPRKVDQTQQLLPMLAVRLERVENRLKLLEEEQRGGINLNRFMAPPEARPKDGPRDEGPR